MDKSSGMEMRGEATEKPLPPGVERLTPRSLEEFKSAIKGLTYNALDTTEGTDPGDRRSDVGHLYEQFLENGELGEIFVVRDGEEIVGFIAIRKDPQSNTVAVERLRLVHEHGQQDVIERLMVAAKDRLEDEGYHHIDVPEGALNEDVFAVINRHSHVFSVKKEAEFKEAA